MIRTICVSFPFGDVYVSEQDGCIVRVDCQKREVTESSPLLERTKLQLIDYMAGVRKTFDLPLSVHGTVFQKAVWKAMQNVAYGTCVSYQKLAEMAGYPTALRAVGTACGKNPIAIVIPCHRIVRSDGTIGNYAWGSEMKQFLIDLEKKENER